MGLVELAPSIPVPPPSLPPPFVYAVILPHSPIKAGALDACVHRRSGDHVALAQGSSLRSGLCCPRPSSLTRPHPPHSQAHRGFTAPQLIRDAFAVRVRRGDP